jgi:hypothetical protein
MRFANVDEEDCDDVVVRARVPAARAARSVRRSLFVVAIATVIVASGCATSKMAPPTSPAVPDAVAPLVGVEPVALQAIDAPGFAVDVLTARLREAFARTSGADVVDAVSVRAEIAACVAAPCSEVQQERFRAARYIAGVTLSKVGDVVLGSAQLLAGADELGRVSARGADVGAVVDDLGWQLGARFRSAVSGRAASISAPTYAPISGPTSAAVDER